MIVIIIPIIIIIISFVSFKKDYKETWSSILMSLLMGFLGFVLSLIIAMSGFLLLEGLPEDCVIRENIGQYELIPIQDENKIYVINEINSYKFIYRDSETGINFKSIAKFNFDYIDENETDKTPYVRICEKHFKNKILNKLFLPTTEYFLYIPKDSILDLTVKKFS